MYVGKTKPNINEDMAITMISNYTHASLLEPMICDDVGNWLVHVHGL